MERDASFELAGRLRPGTNLVQAQAEALPIWRGAEAAYWRDLWNRSPQFVEQRLKDSVQFEALDRGVSILRDRFGVALQLLLACGAALLLLVCANVAGLLVAWNVSRQREIAVRLAVGATRGALVRQLLAENLLLAAGGTAGGMALATMAGPLFVPRAATDARLFEEPPCNCTRPRPGLAYCSVRARAMLAGTLLVFGVMPAVCDGVDARC
jgi:predicted lysophospholipase L1 biosynthesis ABC-type transport system permease subunit